MRIESLLVMALTFFLAPPLWTQAQTSLPETSESQGLEMGQPAPPFTCLDQHGQEVSLVEFKGRWVVLYFFPKADTPGCTAQACELSDDLEQFDELQAVVLGMSPDSVEDLKRFADKHRLQITLLSDVDRQVMRTYRAITSEGRSMRSTVIINPEGLLVHHWPSVHPRGHARIVREKLQELRQAASEN